MASFGVILAVALAVIGYRHHEQVGNAAAWIMLISIGILICSFVLLAGLFSTAPGAVLFVAGAGLATISGFRLYSSERWRGRAR